jgi:serine/threonine protein kinase
VSWVSDAVLAHLCTTLGAPDVGGTRYELVEKIGQGGMGSVYRARDRVLDRPVALKVLHDLPRETQAAARLVQEAHIIARLEHPGIVPVHDSGILPDGRFYYAMKLVRGQRLDQADRHLRALPASLVLFQKICDAVAFAHAHGIIHRDLKPQNVMLGPFGEVLVMDWGVAKEVGGEGCPSGPPDPNGAAALSVQTRNGAVVGTPGYMAPEQARAGTVVDARTDVYALGGILYFLLTGEAPAPNAGGDARGGPRLLSPRQRDRTIPRPLEAICLKALAAEPAARYVDVPELALDIAQFLPGKRVSAYRESLWELSWRLGMKYRTVIGLIVAYLLMRIGLLFFAKV